MAMVSYANHMLGRAPTNNTMAKHRLCKQLSSVKASQPDPTNNKTRQDNNNSDKHSATAVG
jgi:hypothetical protein